MRITIVTETFFPQVNGVSRTLGQLTRVLEAAGDTVQVVHPDYGEPPPEGKARHLVRSVNPKFYQELHVPLPPFGPVKRAIDAFGPDLVHVATEATLGLVALRHALKRGLPVVSSFHTNFDQYAAHYHIGWLTPAVWRYLRWFHNRTKETYVPSNATIADLKSRGFERLVLWPRGVHGDVFRPDRPGRATVRQALGIQPDELVIGHVSRIAAEKNVAYLAEALRRVEAARPSVRLLIVGDGPARPELEAALGPAARFAGYRSGEDLADHYAAMDVFAFASLTETFGNVILEAMASGLPVVAVRAGGPGDIVREDDTGFLIDPKATPETFAGALLRLVDDPERRRRMAGSARAYALSQSWDAIMMGLRERYLGVLAASTPTGRGVTKSS